MLWEYYSFLVRDCLFLLFHLSFLLLFFIKGKLLVTNSFFNGWSRIIRSWSWNPLLFIIIRPSLILLYRYTVVVWRVIYLCFISAWSRSIGRFDPTCIRFWNGELRKIRLNPTLISSRSWNNGLFSWTWPFLLSKNDSLKVKCPFHYRILFWSRNTKQLFFVFKS